MLPTALLLSCAVMMSPPQSGPDSAQSSTPRSSIDLEALLRSDPAQRFDQVLDAAGDHRLQILVSEVDLSGDRPVLVRSELGDPETYFYPASSIKTAAAVAALVWMNRCNEEQGRSLSLQSKIRIEPRFEGDTLQQRDPSNLAEGHAITVGHEIRKLFLVSDNVAYNRLYELVGHREINEAMWAGGFASTRILHRLSEFRSVEEQRQTRAVGIGSAVDAAAWLKVPERDSDCLLHNDDYRGIQIGDAHYRGGKRVEAPLSFRDKNSISLRDLQDMLVAIVRPEIETGKRGFPELSIPQRAFVREAMSQLPRESTNPRYDPKTTPDHTVKFLLPGVRRVLPSDDVRIYNKVGRAYGFSIENAYIENVRTGQGVFVSAVLYTNPNRVLNDNTYAYESVADPFLADLGEVLARRVLTR